MRREEGFFYSYAAKPFFKRLVVFYPLFAVQCIISLFGGCAYLLGSCYLDLPLSYEHCCKLPIGVSCTAIDLLVDRFMISFHRILFSSNAEYRITGINKGSRPEYFTRSNDIK